MADESRRTTSNNAHMGFGGPRGGMGPAEKPKNASGTFRRLLGYLRPQAMGLIVVFTSAILATCFNIFAPKKLGEATTLIFNGVIGIMSKKPGAGVDFDGLLQILITVLLLYMAYAAFTYVQQFVMARVTQNVIYGLRQETEEKLNRLPLSFYDSRPKGEVLSRVVNDIDLVSSTLQDSLAQSITAVISLVGILAMMLSISPLMTLIALVSLPVSMVFMIAIAKRSQRFYAAQQETLGQLDAHIEETYGGHTEVKAFTHEKDAEAEFDEVNRRYFGHAWKAQFISGIVRPLMGFIGNLTYVAVCVVGAWQVTLGAITVGDIQAFIQYTRNFSMPITQIASIVNIIQSTLAASERVFEVLDQPELSDESGLEPFTAPVKGHVEFDHVRFGYRPDTPIIKDLCEEIEPGQTVAIVGPTGAGKSTLVNLLMRFYEIGQGEIRLDGVSIAKMTRHDLRRHFGMVLQDTWLFSGTIRENIAYGVEGATDEQVEKAAKAAYADHFIRTLPDGYDTVINEEATNISVGQKQLLTIARALLADPEMLILDEATSSIDTRTERLVQKAMNKMTTGRTSFVIAHRLSTIREADVIMVMREGDIVEQGTHSELLARGGFYAELYNSQFVECIDELNEEM